MYEPVLPIGIILHILCLQDTSIPPPLPEQSHADWSTGFTLDILGLQNLILPPKSEEVREQRIEMWLGPKMKNFRIMRVVYVGKYSQKLAVDVLDRCGERGRELLAYGFQVNMRGKGDQNVAPYQILTGIRSRRREEFVWRT